MLKRRGVAGSNPFRSPRNSRLNLRRKRNGQEWKGLIHIYPIFFHHVSR